MLIKYSYLANTTTTADHKNSNVELEGILIIIFYFTYFTLIHNVVGLSLFIDPGVLKRKSEKIIVTDNSVASCRTTHVRTYTVCSACHCSCAAVQTLTE